jgi:dihydropteroate synthase
MGVVNVTPDSFSDGGRWFDPAKAVAHARQLVAEGADIIDVGGESTRPGAAPVPEIEETRRVVPVIEALADQVRVSVDTRHPAVARAALAAGATLVNDTSASLWPIAAEAGAGWIAMHMLGEPSTMQTNPRYNDVVAEVTEFLVERAEAARAGGVGEVWIDPGIGFGKTGTHNVILLAHLASLVATGWPVVIGTSRKSFLGRLQAGQARPVPGVDDRLEGSVSTATWAMTQGASMVRVHDVQATVAAARIVGCSLAGRVSV